MIRLTATELHILTESYYGTPSGTAGTVCADCGDALAAGQLIYPASGLLLHTHCLVPHLPAHHLHQLVHHGAR